jgi:hypothetical protein
VTQGTTAERLVADRVRAALPPDYRLFSNVAWLARTAANRGLRDGEADIEFAHPDPGFLVFEVAARDALGLGTPEAVTFCFTGAAVRRWTTRTHEQLDAAADDLVARAERIRSDDFAATPGKPCYFCDFAAMCPARCRGATQ